jgi:hypothetical protein
MPYSIKSVPGGFKVCDDKRCFSKKPLSKKIAKKQRVAIALSEHKANPEKSMKMLFA